MITGWGEVRVDVRSAFYDPDGANCAQVALFQAGRREYVLRTWQAIAALAVCLNVATARRG